MEPTDTTNTIADAPVTAPPARKRGRPPKKTALKEPEQAQEVVQEVAPELDDLRPDLRPTYREEDPRTRAARRAAELRNHGSTMDEGVDEFFIPVDIIPAGWDYEWKRHTLFNKEDPAYAVQVARAGWEPVPARRHPEMMPSGWQGTIIERKGMILMERPKEISEESRNIELRKARSQVRQKEQQLNQAPDGTMQRDNKGTPLSSVKKSYEAIPIPKD